MTLFPIPALTFILMQLNLCRETVAITYFNFLYQLATSVEATQLYDQASPAQQKNAAIVNSLFQLHQSVTKVTLSIRQPIIDHSRNTVTYHNALCLSPSKPCILKHRFQFLLGPFKSQEKLKTLLMQNFGLTSKEHYGMLWYFLEWSIASLCYAYEISFLYFFMYFIYSYI